MPELPEVETVCRGLRPKMEGRRLVTVIQRRPDLRFPLPAEFSTRLTGRVVERIERRAKYILAHLDDGWTLMAHLGMSGRMTLIDGPPPTAAKHDHIEFLTDEGTTIRYNDARRFGFMELIETSTLGAHPMLRDLGPEPLSNAFNAVALSAALHGRRSPIKAALLDQKTVAGLGNIYVCEALFRAAISPKRSAHTIPGRRAERLVTAIRDVLTAAIAAGGSSLRDYVQADGELGYFQHNWRVYGHEGDPCGYTGCEGTIGRIVQSGRSTFYCGKHQR
ncbi:MAG: bifunctional DNA-formamidopyrimidine glycosylase/DNA-(apurinic or apyrimidinic site) lyase [Rickettsiales bacterium]